MIGGWSGTAPASIERDYDAGATPLRSDALLRQVVLDVHNRERRALGVPALAWDDGLAADAADYARRMARTNVFRHSADADTGENLWMGTRRAFSYQAMFDGFVQERRAFRPRQRFPDVSTTGDWQDVGHYSQMIWRGTRRVGCALEEGARFDYLVCRYYPAGNVEGMSPFDAEPAVLAGLGG